MTKLFPDGVVPDGVAGSESDSPRNYARAYRMLPDHQEIIDLYVQNLPIKTIAEQLGKPVRTINAVISNPANQDQIARRKARIERKKDEMAAVNSVERIKERYAEELDNSIDTILDVRDNSTNDSVRLKAAQSVIDTLVGGYDQQKTMAPIVIEKVSAENIMIAIKESGELD